MDGFRMSHTPEKVEDHFSPVGNAAFEKIATLIDELASPLKIAGAISEDELNSCPYQVRKALYDYAAMEFAFFNVALAWARERTILSTHQQKGI